MALGIMLACIGCASAPLPQSRAEFEAAIGQSCEGVMTVCNVYEALPPEARNARDDATCTHSRRWCVAPIKIDP
jgi:hypothetical protein